MTTVVRKNERSWAIELISKINMIAASNDVYIKRAGGESTISTGRGNRMFPDVILYGNSEQSLILQGWELKMPDVPIEDEIFIKDAQRKAIALNLNSCLIWNFTYAALYAKNEENEFYKIKQWNSTSHIRTREDVETYQSDWQGLLEEIIIELSGYFSSGKFRNVNISNIISENMVTLLIQRNKGHIADKLKYASVRNAIMEAYIDNWWYNIKSEYENDETDKYNAYAKSVVLNWANRILFAHLIKSRQISANIIDELSYNITPDMANEIFEKISSKCDFYNIFNTLKYNNILPDISWQDFVEFSNFLKYNNIENLSQKTFQNILEGSVTANRRALNGQFTTPVALAKILVRLTVKDWTDNILDCCCGTGTIPKTAIELKKERLSTKAAVESVWACDKYKYPLQVANISMTSSDTIHIANRLFQHNALSLSIGENISIIDPETGEKMYLSLPEFGSVVSNLPFVSFEIIPTDDKEEIIQMPVVSDFDGRSDLYCYIAVKISDIIKPGGTLGIIVSNSWLGTNAGVKFIHILEQKYTLKQVHISGKGRWFQNADVVTTIIILEKKKYNEVKNTTFWLWKKTLKEINENNDTENILVNSALLETELNHEVAQMSSYSQNQIQTLLNLNVSYNALFHNVDWLIDIREKILPIKEVFHVFRGSRRGWDALFYPQEGQHKIESIYLKKVLVNARNVTSLIAIANRDAFCCDKTVEELKALGHYGALEWIAKFEYQRNGVGKPLPEVLKRIGMQWYELRDNEIAEIFTMMNPDQRLFFAKFEEPSFINQRLIGLRHKELYSDEELNHALLNSMLTMFYIEASGFGRGLGVLDVNKESIAKCYMLNPKLVNAQSRNKILSAFEKIKTRQILKVSEELCNDDRLNFEYEILRSFKIENYFSKIRTSLLSLQESRATART